MRKLLFYSCNCLLWVEDAMGQGQTNPVKSSGRTYNIQCRFMTSNNAIKNCLTSTEFLHSNPAASDLPTWPYCDFAAYSTSYTGGWLIQINQLPRMLLCTLHRHPPPSTTVSIVSFNPISTFALGERERP